MNLMLHNMRVVSLLELMLGPHTIYDYPPLKLLKLMPVVIHGRQVSPEIPIHVNIWLQLPSNINVFIDTHSFKFIAIFAILNSSKLGQSFILRLLYDLDVFVPNQLGLLSIRTLCA